VCSVGEAFALTSCTRHDRLLSKGQWKLDTGSKLSTVLVSCPTCGKTFPLTGAEVYANGFVSPRVVCPFRCGFDRRVRLDGWRE
jgi:hypothetical protein